jgi:hypothetical protein
MKPASIEVGKCYYRKSGLTISVRKVERIAGDDIHYRVLCGAQLKQRTHNRARLKNFLQWTMGEVAELSDYSHLNGCRQFTTFLVKNTQGEPILRCNEHKGRFYLRKGYAIEVEPGILQFTNDITEKRLQERYQGQFSEFFLAVKNDHCVVCGKGCQLTRHHVVPQRVKPIVPQPYRACLSNILFVCMSCHEKYERTPEPDIPLGDDPLDYCRQWKAHFLAVMDPKFMPGGWDIISSKDIDTLW